MSYGKVKDHVKDIEYRSKELFWDTYMPSRAGKVSKYNFIEKFPNPYYQKLKDNKKSLQDRKEQLSANRVT